MGYFAKHYRLDVYAASHFDLLVARLAHSDPVHQSVQEEAETLTSEFTCMTKMQVHITRLTFQLVESFVPLILAVNSAKNKCDIFTQHLYCI